MGNSFSFAWEDRFILWLQQFMTGGLVKLAGFITNFGDELILIGVVGLFYWSLNKALGKRLVVSLSFVNIVYPCVKTTVRRLRPYMANRDIQCLKAVSSEGDIYDVVSQEFSFPSGHANNCVAVYGTLANRAKSVLARVGLILLCLLVGLSRCALGVHYPTDILAGWLLACVCVSVYGLLEKALGRYRTYLLLDVLGLAGFFIAKTNDFYTGYGLLLGSTLGIVFEEKYVSFPETRNPLRCILRTAVGAGLFLGLNTLLKLPFSREFLNSGTFLSFSVRAARYAVLAFLLLGVYPLCFRWFNRKKPAGNEDTIP